MYAALKFAFKMMLLKPAENIYTSEGMDVDMNREESI